MTTAFLDDVRGGHIPLRGRSPKGSESSASAFLEGLQASFPDSEGKSFSLALARLWVRWRFSREDIAWETGWRAGAQLRQEYEDGIANALAPSILHKRLHLLRIRDFLRMSDWLRETITFLARESDWESRQLSEILSGNFASILSRALHNRNAGYAAEAVAALPRLISQLDRITANLAATEPETSHFLRKYRSTILTRALHSGNLEYPNRAAVELPRVLHNLNSSPKANQRDSKLSAAIYRILTNGRF